MGSPRLSRAVLLVAVLLVAVGLGVRPALYSRKNSANTRSLYSAAQHPWAGNYAVLGWP